MRRSALTATLRVYVTDNDHAVMFYVGIFGDLEFVTLCSVPELLRTVREFSTDHGFEVYDVGFVVQPDAVAALEQTLLRQAE